MSNIHPLFQQILDDYIETHAQHGCPPDCTCNSYPGCGHKDCLVAWVETGEGVCLRGGE